MKKTLKLFSILALLLCVVSCQNANIDGLLYGGKLTATAVIDGTDASRVTYAVDNETAFTITPTWTVGDQIIGFDDKGVKFTFVVEAEEGGVAGLNVGAYVPGDATKLYAIYAPGCTESQIDNNELAVDLSTQDGALNNSSKVYMYSTAAIEAGTVRFRFEKATAIVGLKKFKLPVTFSTAVTKMKLHGVATTGTFRVVDGALTFVPGTTPGTVTATRTWMTGSDGICSTPVYFSVIPTKDAQMSLDADTPSKSYVNFRAFDKMDIEAGYYYHMTKVFYSPEATVNDQPYDNVVEAFDAANEIDGDVTITLLSNCQADAPIVLCNVNGNYTLDLNGKTLTTTSTNTMILSLCKFTITDSSSDDPAAWGALTTQSTNTDKYVLYVQDEAQLTMTKGKITAPAYRCICFKDGGSGLLGGNAQVLAPNAYAIYLSETGGTLDIEGDARIAGKSNVIYYGTGKSTITGGIISNTASGAIVYVSGDAELTVSGNCRINTTYLSNRNPVYANGSAKAYVTGGYYGMPIYNVVSHDSEGAKYVNVLNEDPATSADYPYTLMAAPGNEPLITTSSAEYRWDFADVNTAIKHADERSTKFAECGIILNKDLNLTETFSMPSSHQYGLTLDLNGFKLNSSASPAVSTAGNLTVEDVIGTGEICSSGTIGLSATAGTITINGGSLAGATTAFDISGTASATIYAGWFSGGDADLAKSGSTRLLIYGGKFKNSPSAFVGATDIEAISETHNGRTYSYAVTGAPSAATVNGEGFPTFANALAKALIYDGAEDTVVLRLMSDVSDYDKYIDMTNTAGKPIVFDLNGYTFGVVIDSCMTTTGSLTITDRSGLGTGKYTSSKRKQLYIKETGKVVISDCIIECTRGGYMSTGATYTMISAAGTSSNHNTDGLTIINSKVYSTSYLKPIYAAYGSLRIYNSELTCGTEEKGGYYIVDIYTGGNVVIENSSFATFDRKSNGDKYGCVHTRTGNISAGSTITLKNCWFYSGKGLSTAADHAEYSKVFTIENCYSNIDFKQYLPNAVYPTGQTLKEITPVTHTHMGTTYTYGYHVE